MTTDGGMKDLAQFGTTRYIPVLSKGSKIPERQWGYRGLLVRKKSDTE